MAKTQTPANLLQQVVNETSGTALTISPKEDKWTGYLLQQKQSFEAVNVDDLYKTIADAIIAKRVAVEVKEGGKKKSKPFKYSV